MRQVREKHTEEVFFSFFCHRAKDNVLLPSFLPSLFERAYTHTEEVQWQAVAEVQ